MAVQLLTPINSSNLNTLILYQRKFQEDQNKLHSKLDAVELSFNLPNKNLFSHHLLDQKLLPRKLTKKFQRAIRTRLQ